MSVLDNFAAQVASGGIEIVDLTTPLRPETPILHLPEPFANTVGLSMNKVSNFDDDGPGWSWNDLTLGEHAGTHVDAPVHWASGKHGRSIDEIPPSRLVGPIVVIDKTAESANDPDFLLEPEHLEAFLNKHGDFEHGTWLILKTGWSAYGEDPDEFANVDDNGSHTPGVSVDGAKWIARNPAISGFGVETVGVDAGGAAVFDPMFPVHHYLLGADKYGLTSLRNIDALPETGATIVVAPLPIVGGTGSPARAYALVEKI